VTKDFHIFVHPSPCSHPCVTITSRHPPASSKTHKLKRLTYFIRRHSPSRTKVHNCPHLKEDPRHHPRTTGCSSSALYDLAIRILTQPLLSLSSTHKLNPCPTISRSGTHPNKHWHHNDNQPKSHRRRIYFLE